MNKSSFVNFLRDSGCVILKPTNEWEFIRFDCEKGVGVIYKNSKNNSLSFTGPAKEAYDHFKKKKPWKSANKKKRTRLQQKIDVLWQRDGNRCFYCDKPFTEDEPETLEHILSISNGGNNHLDNLVLAHGFCNRQADNMSIIEKVRFREGVIDAERQRMA